MEIRAEKVTYKVIAITPKGEKLDITQAVEGLAWQENENEISTKITFSLYNVKYDNQRLSVFVRIGSPIMVFANWGSGSGTVATGIIRKATRTTSQEKESYDITAYDVLYTFQKSQDNVYFSSGKSTKAAITEVLSKWGITLKEYTGPDVKHGEIVYKGKTLSDIVRGILEEAVDKGGCKAICRCEGQDVSIIKVGSNENVFGFGYWNTISNAHEISIENLVTRVLIVSSGKKEGNPAIEATMDGQTEFGILQKIQQHNKSETLDDAKKAAKKILDKDGKAKSVVTLQAPDVPPMRKGDKIFIKIGRQKENYIVKTISHNADKGSMQLTAEKED